PSSPASAVSVGHCHLIHCTQNRSVRRISTRTPPPPPFTAQPGIQVETANLTTPVDFLELFFMEDLYALIVDQSNLYAQQFIAANTKFKPCQTIRMETYYSLQIKNFFGLTLNISNTKTN
ncbi:unnamed protein product, partial [Staurois parvus]